MWFDWLQRVLLLFGLILSALLLVKFAVDFNAEAWWLAASFWLLVMAALGLSAANLFTRNQICREGRTTRGSITEALRLIVVPVAFLACSLDCMGLALVGCTAFCTFIKLMWVPLIGLVCAIHYFTRRREILLAITAMSFLPLVPHCSCYNVANVWWIELLGKSPQCYIWGFTVSLIAASSLRVRSRDWVSLVVCGAIIFCALAFFVAHHYFRYPW
jgi:hypothetical protein